MHADRFKEVPNEEELNLGFQHGFEAVVECRKSLSWKTWSYGIHMVHKYIKSIYFNENLLIFMQSIHYKQLT